MTAPMDGSGRHVDAINSRIGAGDAVVLTEAELAARRLAGDAAGDVDVVVVAFRAGLSGTSAMLCVPVAGRGDFTRAETIRLNGVPGHPGPAPNERLGVVDTLVLADAGAEEGAYDGAALLYDLVRGAEIAVECRSVEDTTHAASVTLADLEFARMYVYNAFVGGADNRFLHALGGASRVLLNGAQGLIVGTGTRDRLGARALSLAADMAPMEAALMAPTDGTAPRHTVCVAVPVLNGEVLDALQARAGQAEIGDGDGAPAERLKAMILAGGFVLTDTDLGLGRG